MRTMELATGEPTPLRLSPFLWVFRPFPYCLVRKLMQGPQRALFSWYLEVSLLWRTFGSGNPSSVGVDGSGLRCWLSAGRGSTLKMQELAAFGFLPSRSVSMKAMKRPIWCSGRILGDRQLKSLIP